MSEISFVIRTDAHVTAHAPASRIDNYLESCLDKLAQIGELAKEVQAAAVLDNGDFFHLKEGSRNPHSMMVSVVETHQAYPCPTYVNPGNHDFPYGQVSYVDKQPLGLLFATGVFKRMSDVTFTEGDLKVRVVGFPYKVTFTHEEFDLERGDEDILIVCAHTYATPTGGETFGQEVALSYKELAKTSPDVFVFGHLHKDQGIQEVNGKPIFNLGSMTRGSLVEDNLSRIPRVGILSVTKEDGCVKVTTRAHELKVAPASEIFDLQKRDELILETQKMTDYLDQLKRLKTDVAQTPEDRIRYASFSDQVRESALSYLQRVS